MEQPNPDRPDAVNPVAPTAVATPPLTPLEWLKVNGPMLLIVAAGLIWLYAKLGIDGIYHGALVVVGLGLVIFIHELGHFVAAKWCDVHVQTFSIGFGPALPGCSFQRGETLYKIALLPLGGYVNMVGEGSEADEDENYPRSFKNKTVGQRMLIISAGVVMNVILGCLCFVLVYRFHGEPRATADIAHVEPGSPAWQAGLRYGMSAQEINGVKDPWWDDLKIEVAFSTAGQSVPFDFRLPEGGTRHLDLTPRRDEGSKSPTIGVAPMSDTRLIGAKQRSRGDHHLPPCWVGSAAAAARVVDFKPGDVVLACTDPETTDKISDLPAGSAGIVELGRRVRLLVDKPITLRVRRAGRQSPEEVQVPIAGFEFDDAFVGTSDPAASDPFTLKPLSAKESAATPDTRDFFELHRRLTDLAGRSMLVQVNRKGSEVVLFVPPAYHRTLGLRMTMQAVTALRDGSPAEQAGVQIGDTLTKIVLQRGSVKREFNASEIDPVRLPDELSRFAGLSSEAVQAKFWVTRGGKETKEIPLPAEGSVAWDRTFDYAEEQPGTLQAPESIPQLGLAYRIESRVAEVVAGSPADAAGILRGDIIEKIRFRMPYSTKGETPDWRRWIELKAKPPSGPEGWAAIFAGLQEGQGGDLPEVQVLARRDGALLYFPGATATEPAAQEALVPTEDTTWPLVDRGWFFQTDFRMQKTDNTLTALGYGVKRTGDSIRSIYLGLRSLLTRRISSDNLAGPPDIVVAAFVAAEQGPFELMLFLGMISINLAVVNFLPIPLLDGGHMVFLIYEWLRGKPPSETVRAAAAYIGLALIGSLLVFVMYLFFTR